MARRKVKTINSSKKDTSGKIKHKTKVIDNIKFDSTLESKYYEYLKEQKEKGEVLNFELQKTFLLQDKFIIYNGQAIYGEDKDYEKIRKKEKLPVIRAIKYIADFVVEYKDNLIEVIDTKGLSTADFEIKKKLFMCKYPNMNIKVMTFYEGKWIDYYECKKLKKAKKALKKNNNKEGK